MGTLLLVGLLPDEELDVSAATTVGAVGAVTPDPTGLTLAAALDDTVDAVVVGSTVEAPLPLVERVHRSRPECGVVVLTTEESDPEVRRATTYAPGMPAHLVVVRRSDRDLAGQVAAALEAGRARRAHRETLAALHAREPVPGPQRPVPASLGSLLAHAPFGVLVGNLDGRLVTWNRWAEDILELPVDAAGQPIPSLFPTPDYLEGAFALARQGHLDQVGAATSLEGPTGAAIEVSTAPTLLEDGREAVLVLVQDVSARRQAETTRDRLAAHVGLLGRVSEALAGTLDVDTALHQLAGQMIPSLADWIAVHTHDPRGQGHRLLVRHRDPAVEREVTGTPAELVSGLAELAHSHRAAAEGEPVLLEAVSDGQSAELVPDAAMRAVLRRLGLASVVSVPLPGRDEVLGAMFLVRTPASPAYSREDLAIAVEVGRRAGVALDTLSLYARQRDLAAELQRSLLTDPPAIDRAEVAVRYVAASEEAQVGGDWYDAFVQRDGSPVLVIGDVVGHDTRAAAAMGQLRALLRGIGYTTGTGPAEMLSRLDAAIEGLDVGTTATGLVVRVDPGHARGGSVGICWSNAGHPPPILVGPGGPARVLEKAEPDLLLGVLAHTTRREGTASLAPGGTLLLYTDGLIERRDESLDRGVRRLAAAVERFAELPLQAMCDRLLAELLPEDNDDDVALVALRLHDEGSGAVPQ